MPLDVYDDADEQAGSSAKQRPYVCIFFECCNVYARVYRRRNEKTYRGRCPRCLRAVRLRVGPDGTPARMFRAR